MTSRINTGVMRFEGNLENVYQLVKVNTIMPEKIGDELLGPKIEVSQVLKRLGDRDFESDYFSFRISNVMQSHAFFVSYALAHREMMRVLKDADMRQARRDLQIRITNAWKGRYDSQIKRFSW